MLKTLKQSLLRGAKRLRVLDVVADSAWRRNRLLILCYHSVSVDEEHGWRRALYFTSDEFDERLRMLHEFRVNVLPLGEGVARLRAGTLPDRSVVLTFDDGTADFGNLVWPRLKRYGYPATAYVTTYYSEKRHPIFPLICSYLLWKSRRHVIRRSAELGVADDVDLATPERRLAVERAILQQADREQLTADQKDDRARRLADWLGIDYADLLRRRVLQLMTPEEMRATAADGADIQLHTHRHRVPRERALFDREIADNRSRLQKLTDRPLEHFCYPSGVNFPEFLPWLEAQKIATATTTNPGLASVDSRPLLLPRFIDTAGASPIELEGWLSGFSQILPRRSGQ
jgi:peptidoglycan/xylan/chitin deacetylase (PgdA/CDA1 family)